MNRLRWPGNAMAAVDPAAMRKARKPAVTLLAPEERVRVRRVPGRTATSQARRDPGRTAKGPEHRATASKEVETVKVRATLAMATAVVAAASVEAGLAEAAVLTLCPLTSPMAVTT